MATAEFIEKAVELLSAHEAVRLAPYRCPAGKLTIGIGRNLEDKGISRAEAIYMCENDIIEAIHDLKTIFNWEYIDEVRQLVLMDMRFNLGPGGFRSFKKMIMALRMADYAEAAEQLKDSSYYRQVGQRGLHNYNAMKKGELP